MTRGEQKTKHLHILDRLVAHNVPGVAVAIIEDYDIIWISGYGSKRAGLDEPVDGDTVFSVGSVSKMVNAALALRLVDTNKITLDNNINQHLVTWQVPSNRYSRQSPVTLRKILAHTAGFSQHGFPDFLPGEALPNAIQTLNGLHPAKHSRVRLMFTPGVRMDYSGGGITVSQVAIEDVTKLDYPTAAKKWVFEPLNMTRSTFENPLPNHYGNVAFAHDSDGEPVGLPRGYEAMPEMAASGLWTSAKDLANFVIALMNSHRNDEQFLTKSSAQDMMTRVANSWYGLGPRLNGNSNNRVFHHGGANNSYRAWIEGHLATGSGIVILTNGTNGHWIYREMRRSAARAFNWPINQDTGYEEPNL